MSPHTSSVCSCSVAWFCRYKTNVTRLMKDCFGDKIPQFLQTYMTEVYALGYTDKPNYSRLRKIFTDHLHGRDPTKTLEWVSPGPGKVCVLCRLLLAKAGVFLPLAETITSQGQG